MLKLLSLNARGLGTPAKRDLFIREISLLSCDLILLQGPHVCRLEQANEFSRNWAAKCYWSFGGARSAGVGLRVSPSSQGSVTRFTFDSDGRVISALILMGSHQINIVNVYAPNTVSDRKAFFQNLHTFFLSPIRIVAGDFKCIDSVLDRLSSSNLSLPDKTMFQAFVTDCSLVDVWRRQNPRGVSFTRANASYTQALFVQNCDTLPCAFSDHDFVSLHLTLDGFSCPQNGVWKFNSSLLSDNDFKSEMSSLINTQKQRHASFASLGAWWDDLKLNIRNFCISFSSRKRARINRERNRLTKCLI